MGLAAQHAAIEVEADRRGWNLTRIYEDAGVSGKSIQDRHGLDAALLALRDRHAAALVVSKLDRLSRSLLDFAAVMDRSRREGWSLVALDLGVDTTTPAGEMMANVMATFAQFERRVIGQRTRDALAIRRAQGVPLGRPRTVPEATVTRINDLRMSGLSWRAVAAVLNNEAIPTGHGATSWSGAAARYVALSRRSDDQGVPLAEARVGASKESAVAGKPCQPQGSR